MLEDAREQFPGMERHSDRINSQLPLKANLDYSTLRHVFFQHRPAAPAAPW
jgi:hypothetical protein